MNANVPTSPAAIISLVAGLLSWGPVPLIGAIVAVVTGHMARATIRRAPAGSIKGDGLALAGLILGWLNIVAAVVALAVLFIAFATGH